MADQLPEIPNVNAPNWAQKVTEALRLLGGRTGGGRLQAVTRSDVAGLAGTSTGGGGTVVIGGGGGGTYTPDLTPPPTPTGLTVTAGMTYLIIECDNQTYTEGHGHDRTVIYGASRVLLTDPAPTFADAVELAQFQGTVYAHPVTLGVIWHIWIKWRSVDAVLSASPEGGTNGVSATTGKVGNSDLADAIITSQKLAAGAVDALATFGSGFQPIVIVAALPNPVGYTGAKTVFLTTDSKLYRYTGSAWTNAIPTTDLSGTVADAQIAGLAASKVTGQLTDAQIAALATTKLTGQISTTQITDGGITTAKLATHAVTANEIAAGAVTTNELAANAVTTGKLAAGAVTTATLAAGAVTATEIGAGAVTTAKLAAGAVTANEIAADAVTASKLQAGAVVAGKIAAGSIVAGDGVIANAAITNALIADATIQSAKIVSLSVAKLTAGSLAVGQWLRSTSYTPGSAGWAINADGSVEFSNATLRGTIYASAGQIGGVNINSSAIFSSNWNGTVGPSGAGFAINNDGTAYLNNALIRGEVNTGSYLGYNWPPAGSYGSHLSASGLLIGNANNGTYFQVDQFGNVFAPAFSIVWGTATFSGVLSAAGGTFAGALSAAGGTFAGSLTSQVVNTGNIVGAAVSSTSVAVTSGSSLSLTVTAPAGSSGLTIFVYSGTSTASPAGEDSPGGAGQDWVTVTLNGALIMSGGGLMMNTTVSPNGTYTVVVSRTLINGSSSKPCQITAILGKR